jgi:uncharacterized phiE125 gp8 family phage protein
MAHVFSMPPVTVTTEPVTLAELKAHLRIDASDEDTPLQAMLTAAREWCEGFQSRKYVSQTVVEKFDDFPDKDTLPLILAWSPLASVTTVAYLNSSGGAATLTLNTDVFADTTTEPGRLYLPYSKTWPDVYDQHNAVTITYVAGYGNAADVPERIKQAIKLLAGWWYENREAGITGTISKELEFTVMALLTMDRIIQVV